MKQITVKLQLDASKNDKNLDVSDEMIKEDIEFSEEDIGVLYFYLIKSIEVKEV